MLVRDAVGVRPEITDQKYKREGIFIDVSGEDRDPAARRLAPMPPLSATVSRQMQAMPRKDTGPELALRRELHRRGLRYRVHPSNLPGRPDIALSRARIAVFVDGCFWHRCPEHASHPKHNSDWWAAKLDANVARDRAMDSLLEEQGWMPLHVWEHENPTTAADTIAALWAQRRADRL